MARPIKVIPAGEILYRGSWQEFPYVQNRIGKSPNYMRTNVPVYMAINKSNALIYGPPVEYKLRCQVRLLNLANPDVVKTLINIAKSNTVKSAIKKAFRVINNEVRRFSRLKYNVHVAKFACALGYDGYYAPRMPYAKYTGFFHPEVVLCDAPSVLTVVGPTGNRRPPPITPKVGVNNELRQIIQMTNYSKKIT